MKQHRTDTQRADAERKTRNRGLDESEEELRDPDSHTPHRSGDQNAAEPERPTTIEEDSESDVAHLENPPQTEGPRERSNEGV